MAAIRLLRQPRGDPGEKCAFVFFPCLCSLFFFFILSWHVMGKTLFMLCGLELKRLKGSFEMTSVYFKALLSPDVFFDFFFCYHWVSIPLKAGLWSEK